MPAATSSNAVAPNGGMKAENSPTEVNNFPPPKTDKPRPHMCGTCQRAFARLEHLKRHERSHTKEKPFECPECARCFARRDLLLRHQQKLHMTTTPSSRPRNRRESVASTTTTGGISKVRKNSVANGNGPAAMRPRANTISHVDAVRVQMMAAANLAQPRNGPQMGHNRHTSLASFAMPDDFSYGMSNVMGHHRMHHGLPKLETQPYSNLDFGGGLRTAPIGGGFDSDFDFEGLLFGPTNTINPNALHYNDSPQSMAMDNPYLQQGFPDMPAGQSLEEDFQWMNGFENQMSFNENAIDGSSPSAISTTSQSGISEVMLDGSSNQAPSSASMWQQSMMAAPLMAPNPYHLDLGQTGFTDLMNGPMSPHSLPPS